MLPKDQFLEVIERTPLVSIDLVVERDDGKLLMGKRVNEPARGTWFVPGGVIRKGETLEQAFQRLTEVELGAAIALSEARLLGAFTHIYETNFAAKPGVSTHYVVLGYRLGEEQLTGSLPLEQHSEYRWLGSSYPDPAADAQARDIQIHPNSAAYFECLI